MAEEPAFKVEEWGEGGHILRRFAGCDNLFIARAAYREGARVLEEHKPK
jgi:hypothetical protein